MPLANNDLDKFLVGEPFCFQEAKSDNDEATECGRSVRSVGGALLARDPATRNSPEAVSSRPCFKILATYPDRNRAIYAAAVWVWWYYRFCLSKKRTNPDGLYADLFEVDMVPWQWPCRSSWNATRLPLSAIPLGGRWLDGQNGLWGPLMRTALVVRDKLGGPTSYRQHLMSRMTMDGQDACPTPTGLCLFCGV